ncbi:MAG: M2 family metallopeptidase [Bacteroidales bacterium]|nr:M2 family metallopeptidase [Bacteroidales bacterium]
MKKKLLVFISSIILLGFSTLIFFSCKQTPTEKMENELKAFIKNFEEKYIPLEKAMNKAYWTATNSGKPEDYKKSEELEIKCTKIFTDKEEFAVLKKIKESDAVKDELLKRQLVILYNSYLENQIDEKKLEEMIQIQTKIEKNFNTFRARVGTKEMSDNDIEEILINSKNSDQLKEAWMAHKKIGPVVAEDVKKLVLMRNEVAKELGFKNYQQMRLSLNEQDPQEIEKLFDELDVLTKDAFRKQKDLVDDFLAKRDNVKKEELMPWHYQNRYFQEAPKIFKVDLDVYYKNKDVVELTKKFYEGIGLPVDDIIKKSDLYEKPGKYQHAYCMDFDRKGDISVLCNIKNSDFNWMNTMLHEFGHAAYAKYIDRSLPHLLCENPASFCSEAIAEFFGRLGANGQWIQDMIGVNDQEKMKINEESFKMLRLQQLVFSRWSQVMYRFEKSMYENPEQDLNKLWWDIVEKYQLMKRPPQRNEPDWATKIHIASYSCYYHNYLLGELFASQVHNYIRTNILKTEEKNPSFVNKKEVGEYMKQKIFLVGAKYFWNDMIEKATGEKLTAKYYAKQFVD